MGTYLKKRQQYFWSLLIIGLLMIEAVGYLGVKLFRMANGQTTDCGCAVDALNSPWFLGLSGLIGLLALSGLVFGLIKSVKVVLLQRRLIRNLRFITHKEEQARIFEQDMPQAFCYGFLHPKIAVSTGLLRSLSPDELKAVIAHEQAHKKSHEPLKILFGEFFSRVFYFIPLVRQLFIYYKTASELAADEAVANDASVSKAIINLSDAIQMPVGTLSNFSAALDARIQRILNKQYVFKLNFSGKPLIISLFFVILLGVVLVWNPESAHAHDQQCQMKVAACHEKQPMPKWEIMDCASGECANMNSNDYLITYFVR